MIEEHVTSHGNHLWHLFSWCDVEYLEGENARKAFDDLQYEEAIKFCDGYSNRIKMWKILGKYHLSKWISLKKAMCISWQVIFRGLMSVHMKQASADPILPE